MDNFLPTGFYDRWKREKSGFSFAFVRYASMIDVHGCAIVALVTRVPLCFMNDSCGPTRSRPASGVLITFRVYLWQYCAKARGKKAPHSDIFLRSGTAGDGYYERSVLSTVAACSHVDCFCFADLAWGEEARLVHCPNVTVARP